MRFSVSLSLAVFTIALSNIALAASSADVAGVYETYNESSFNYKLSLAKNGTARYSAADYEGGKPFVLVGKWQLAGDAVTITFPKEGKYIYSVQEKLSWTWFGCAGASVGLANRSTPQRSKPDANYDLWLQSDVKTFASCTRLPPETDPTHANAPSNATVSTERSTAPATSVASEEVSATNSTPKSVGGINGFLRGLTESINASVARLQSNTTAPVSSQTNAKVEAPPEIPGTMPTDSAPVRKSKVAPISATALNGIFAKHPYDGTVKSQFPRVALTIVDWDGADCWKARAKIWWSDKRSESVGTFDACWRDSFGRAANNAVNYHLFIQQLTGSSSGNVRTEGPKAPMTAISLSSQFGVDQFAKGQQEISFIQQMILETGWQPGAPTNFWVVGYESAKP